MQIIATSYFLLCQYIEALLVTIVAAVFVFFVDKISISSHSVTEVSATPFKYYFHKYMC